MRGLLVQLLLTAVHSLISGPSREFERPQAVGGWRGPAAVAPWTPDPASPHEGPRQQLCHSHGRVSSFCRRRPPRLPQGPLRDCCSGHLWRASGGSLAGVAAQACSGGRLGAYPWGEGRGEGFQKPTKPGEGGRHDALLLCTRWGSPRTPRGLAPPSLLPRAGAAVGNVWVKPARWW